MQGTFQGWVKGKPFGFIKPDDGSTSVFLHERSIESPDKLRAGARLQFEVQESERGRSASSASPAQHQIAIPEGAERQRGRVTAWNARGFGFIASEAGSLDVFIHQSALAPEENGYLCDGDIVEYYAVKNDKGSNALQLSVIGWETPQDHLAAFADLGPSVWADKLADLCEKEPWEYRHSSAPEPLPILRSYVRYTFRRLEETGRITTSFDGKYAAFNTGLVTPNQEEVYAMFSPNNRPNRQPWGLHGFRKASDWDFVENFGASPPQLAHYFDDPSVLLYDRRCELYVNIDHVLENIERFPAHLRTNTYVARQLLISAEATTKKRVHRNYKAAIPQFYRDRGGDGGVQLLLPICLENPAKADLALVVAKNEAGNAYRGSTVLTLDMAYTNARLLTRPDTEWLQP